MKMDEFISKLTARGTFDDPDQALDAAQATLTVLSERITGGEASDLAAQLSSDLGEWAASAASSGGVAMDAEEFCRRIAERADTIESPQEAQRAARAVFELLSEAVSEGEFSDLCAQLPESWQGDLIPA